MKHRFRYTGILPALLLWGCTSSGITRTSGTDAFEGIEVRFMTDQLEFSDSKEVNVLKFIECSSPDVEINTRDSVDLARVGDQKVTYTLSLDGAEKDVEHVFHIVDTKWPEIRLDKTEIFLTIGDQYDPLTNIISVSDPVEGDLPYVERKPMQTDQGWYCLFGSFDTSFAGVFDLTVEASDCNGNMVSRDFRITVREEGDVSEMRYNYIGNGSTMRFHYDTCRSVLQMSEKNKVHLDNMTRDEAMAAGYEPCDICNP